LTIGMATFLVSTLVLLLWIPLRERPGLGTISNIIVIASALQATVWLVPKAGGGQPYLSGLSYLYVFLAIGLIGVGSGLYLTCNLGPGPRDGWMTGIHQRTGWPVARVRLGIEVVVLSIGWLLGGTIGLGTLAFAVLIGPSVGYGLRLAGRIGGLPGRPVSEVANPDFPELDA
ncbi:MAG: YczE/YyaS/YitT family protein, partial [Actinomycetales bacterium]